MGKKGILADVQYCTGCHACEVACKQENNHAVGLCGIKITELIMEKSLHNDRVHFDYFPHFTVLCNMCASRISSGEDYEPACCKHCGTFSLHYGDIDELVKQMKDMPRAVLHTCN